MDENYDFEKKSGRKKRIVVAIVSVLLVVLLALLAASLVKQFILTTYIVSGVSMYPTLDGGSGDANDSDEENGELLYLNKLSEIKRGDIVVFKNPGWNGVHSSALVKRVVALAGDTVTVSGKQLYVNGELIEEDYAYYDPSKPEGSVLFSPDEYTVDYVVPESSVYCMGDNRYNSTDCRIYGAVPLKEVVGKCFMVKGLDGKLRFL
jgi:signal peptidase I